MNWEESKSTTQLKTDFLKSFFDIEQRFFLTGGSALGIFYLDHRLSYDLDFFTQDSINWHLLENAVLNIAKQLNAECRTITASPTFYRYELSRQGESEILDFVLESVPQIDINKNKFGDIIVDTLKEIMLNKICTLVSRCETKDLIDLYFLKNKGYTIDSYFEEAKHKEAGLDPAMISYLLADIEIDEIPEYVHGNFDLVDFKNFIEELRESLAKLSFPEKESS